MLMKAVEIRRAAAPLRAAVRQNIRDILLVLGVTIVGATRLSAQAAVSTATPLLVDGVMTAGAGATVTNAAGPPGRAGGGSVCADPALCRARQTAAWRQRHVQARQARSL
jgi:hypothetical protein